MMWAGNETAKPRKKPLTYGKVSRNALHGGHNPVLDLMFSDDELRSSSRILSSGEAQAPSKVLTSNPTGN